MEGTREIGKGNLDHRINIKSLGELGKLADSFNDMAEDLKKTTTSRDQLAIEINERMYAQEALKESEERYKRLSEVTLEGIIFHDKGVIIDSNTAFQNLCGYSLEELTGKNAIDIIVHPDYRGVVHEKIASQYDKPYEIMAQGKDGTIFPVEIEGREIKYKNEIFRVSSIRDIREKKKLEAQLQRAQKMEAIGTLAGGVAHDLNNILSGLVSYPELLLMDLPQDSLLRDPILTIKKSGEKAAVIVQDLLTLARRGVAITEVLNINQIIFEYFESLEYEKMKSYHSNVHIETNLESNLLNIFHYFHGGWFSRTIQHDIDI